MATQISANFRKVYSCTAYNKTLSNSTKSQPYLQYPSAYKKTRVLHFNTGRVRERPLGAGGLKWSKRDTTAVWFVHGSEDVISHFVEHQPHCIIIIIMGNTAESDYNRPMCRDLFEFLSLKCPCPN